LHLGHSDENGIALFNHVLPLPATFVQGDPATQPGPYDP
jgi:hypothetical protein